MAMDMPQFDGKITQYTNQEVENGLNLRGQDWEKLKVSHQYGVYPSV